MEAFAAEGLTVPGAEIARRAGIGTGTVSRCFLMKDFLYEAIVLHLVDAGTSGTAWSRSDAIAGEPPLASYPAITSGSGLDLLPPSNVERTGRRQRHLATRRRSELRTYGFPEFTERVSPISGAQVPDWWLVTEPSSVA